MGATITERVVELMPNEKRYLNRDERRTVLTLAGFVGYLTELAEKLPTYNKPKKLVTYAKTARTYLLKITDDYVIGLDEYQLNRVLAEGKQVVIAVTSRRKTSTADQMTVDRDDFLDICEQAIVGECQRCKLTGEFVKSCKLQKLFLNYAVEPLDLEAAGGKCPYQH